MQNKGNRIHIENIRLINEIRNGDKDKIVDLMRNNYGIIHSCILKYLSPQTEYDDLMQEAYFGTVRAVKAFDLKRSDRFTIILGLWVNHFMYLYVNKANIRNARQCSSLDSLLDDLNLVPVRDLTDYLLAESVESTYITQSLEEQLWGEVSRILSKDNYKAVYDAYKNQKSYAEIGRALKIGRASARLKVIRSLEKLKKSNKIKILAYDYFSIDKFKWED